jgi:hypothetical protein
MSGNGTESGAPRAGAKGSVAKGSVDRVRAALAAAGHPDTITAFPAGTRTAADAAVSVGCAVAQIAKSIVFRAGGRAAVVITSGANRVSRAKAEAALGTKLKAPTPIGCGTPPGSLSAGCLPSVTWRRRWCCWTRT